MSLSRGPQFQFKGHGHASASTDVLMGCYNRSMADFSSLNQASQPSSCFGDQNDKNADNRSRSINNQMALGDLVSNINESIDSFKQESQSQGQKTYGYQFKNKKIINRIEDVQTPEPERLGNSSMVETFSNIKNAIDNNMPEYQFEINQVQIGVIKRELEQSDLPVVHQSKLNCRGLPLNKRSTLDVSRCSKRVSPLPTTRHEELSCFCTNDLANRHSMLDRMIPINDSADQHHNLFERNSLADGQNDHVDVSSVQTFSDIVSKQNQQIKFQKKHDKESMMANFHLNLETLPDISKQSLVNIDQLLNASRFKGKETLNKQKDSQKAPNHQIEQTQYMNQKSMGQRIKLKCAQRNDSFNKLSLQAAHTSKDQNTISMCTRGTEHTSLEVPKDLELKINETVEVDDLSSPFLLSYPVSVLENTRAPSTPSGMVLDQDIQVNEQANQQGYETTGPGPQVNASKNLIPPVQVQKEPQLVDKRHLKDAGHTKGALSSDYGINRGKLNSRQGTRHNHLIKPTSSKNFKKTIEEQAFLSKPQPNHELLKAKNQKNDKFKPSQCEQNEKQEPKTVSDRCLSKDETRSEWFRQTFDTREQHRKIIATIKQKTATKSAVKSAHNSDLASAPIGKPPGSSSGLIQRRQLETASHVRVMRKQLGSRRSVESGLNQRERVVQFTNQEAKNQQIKRGMISENKGSSHKKNWRFEKKDISVPIINQDCITNSNQYKIDKVKMGGVGCHQDQIRVNQNTISCETSGAYNSEEFGSEIEIKHTNLSASQRQADVQKPAPPPQNMLPSSSQIQQRQYGRTKQPTPAGFQKLNLSQSIQQPRHELGTASLENNAQNLCTAQIVTATFGGEQKFFQNNGRTEQILNIQQEKSVEDTSICKNQVEEFMDQDQSLNRLENSNNIFETPTTNITQFLKKRNRSNIIQNPSAEAAQSSGMFQMMPHKYIINAKDSKSPSALNQAAVSHAAKQQTGLDLQLNKLNGLNKQKSQQLSIRNNLDESEQLISDTEVTYFSNNIITKRQFIPSLQKNTMFQSKTKQNQQDKNDNIQKDRVNNRFCGFIDVGVIKTAYNQDRVNNFKNESADCFNFEQISIQQSNQSNCIISKKTQLMRKQAQIQQKQKNLNVQRALFVNNNDLGEQINDPAAVHDFNMKNHLLVSSYGSTSTASYLKHSPNQVLGQQKQQNSLQTLELDNQMKPQKQYVGPDLSQTLPDVKSQQPSGSINGANFGKAPYQILNNLKGQPNQQSEVRQNTASLKKVEEKVPQELGMAPKPTNCHQNLTKSWRKQGRTEQFSKDSKFIKNMNKIGRRQMSGGDIIASTRVDSGKVFGSGSVSALPNGQILLHQHSNSHQLALDQNGHERLKNPDRIYQSKYKNNNLQQVYHQNINRGSSSSSSQLKRKHSGKDSSLQPPLRSEKRDNTAQGGLRSKVNQSQRLKDLCPGPKQQLDQPYLEQPGGSSDASKPTTDKICSSAVYRASETNLSYRTRLERKPMPWNKELLNQNRIAIKTSKL